MTIRLSLADEDRLLELLDEGMNANGIQPEVAGIDVNGRVFMAWLDEEGGDCVGLRVCVLSPSDGRAEVSEPGEVEAPGQGQTSSLAYPVEVLRS